MAFVLDSRLLSSAVVLGDWSLSRVLLKNNADYPWLILVPRVEGIQEIDDLSSFDRQVLMEEICQLSAMMRAYFKPDKLNVGTLGNIVPTLHVHVVGRYITDPLWPHGIWQAAQTGASYDPDFFSRLVGDLTRLMIG